MSNRYTVVLATYPRNWMLRICAGAMVIYMVTFLTTTRAPYLRDWTDPRMGGSAVAWTAALVVQSAMVLAWWAGAVAVHIREQLADSRSSVYPRFRAPHLLVGAIVMILPCLIFPCFAAIPTALSVSGMIAAFAATMAIAAWVTFRPSPIVLLLSMTAAVLLSRDSLQGALVGFVTGRQSGALLGLWACAVLGALWLRMAFVTGESKERSFKSTDLDPASSRAGEPFAAGSAEASWINANIMRRAYRLDRPMQVYDASLFRRVLHWRMVIGHGWAPWVLAAGIVLSFGIVQFIDRSPLEVIEAWAPIAVACLFALPIVFVDWLRFWRFVGTQILLPISRPRYFLEIGLAMALDLASACGIIILGMLIPLVAWSNLPLRRILISPYQVTAAAFGLVIFALYLQILRLRSAKLAVVLMIFCLIIPAPICAEKFGADALHIAPILVLAAAILLFDAHRRWCNTDLG